jgi:predicted MFS family arabinose efflux permease
MEVSIFHIRAFSIENLVLGVAMLVFIPVFYFASEYAQIALGKSAQAAGLYLLYFFLGFVVTSQIGGRILDRRGAKRPVVIGCALAAVGFALWAGKMADLSFSAQEWYVIMAGAGMGFMLTPASTDAVNRASRLSYGEATGITQTIRNYAASLGLAILGTILVSQLRSRVTTSLLARGVPPGAASTEAKRISESQGGSGSVASIPHFIRLDFAYASRDVFYVMAGIMAVAAVVALVGLQAGLQEDAGESDTDPEASRPEGSRFDPST